MIQTKRFAVAFLLKCLAVNHSRLEEWGAGSVIFCRKLPLAPGAKLFISKCPWVEYTTAG